LFSAGSIIANSLSASESLANPRNVSVFRSANSLSTGVVLAPNPSDTVETALEFDEPPAVPPVFASEANSVIAFVSALDPRAALGKKLVSA